MLTLIQTTLTDGKATDLITLPTERQSSGLFLHMVVATAGSSRHAAALGNRVIKALKSAGHGKCKVEASTEREWTLIDCGDVIVHIMREEARERYKLEALWGFEDGGERT